MPKLRKGETPKSDRHIRRLARLESLSDIRDVISGSSSTEDTTIATRVDLSPPQPETSKESIHQVSNVEQDNVQQENVENVSHNPSTSFAQQNEIVNEEFRGIDTFMDSEDNDSGTDSLTYRYSDSDAESIPSLYDNSDIDDPVDDELLNNFSTNEELIKNNKFNDTVADWAIDYQITHTSLKALLIILNEYTDTKFPKHPGTLLKTPKSTIIQCMSPGEYCHLGLNNAIKNIIATSNVSRNQINILVNIDGAPIAGNSSEKGLWLILCKDAELNSVYVVGIYFGVKKPEDPNEFLKQFVEEATSLIINGYRHNDKTVAIRIHGFICDGPAKAFILNTKHPTGYFSCSKCIIEGEYYGAVYFPLPNLQSLQLYCRDKLREDDKFRNNEYADDYQHRDTVLNKLPNVGLVSNVPLDAMHLVYLGVTRQLIQHWLGNRGRDNKTYKLSDTAIENISEKLENLKHSLPNDFNRRSRSLRYWKLWKATEFRYFLLYFGPFILKDVLPSDLYNNFIMLHISISILVNKKLVSSKDNIDYAESLLMRFIEDFQKLYGKKNVTHNVHNLLHLANDVRKYGPLEYFSAFPFENYIFSIKKLIRKGDKPLQQIARRLSEYECRRNSKSIKSQNNDLIYEKHHYRGVIINKEDLQYQYKFLRFNSWFIDISDDLNNCVLLNDNTIVNVCNVIKKQNSSFIVGNKCDIKNDLYSYKDFRSGRLGIYYVIPSVEIKNWPCNMIIGKVFKIVCTEGFVALPIIHTLE